MPEVDGRAVISYMAAGQHRTPITPDFDPEIIRAVVRKPFDIELLMTTVTELVDSGDQTLR
jgi:hypothetical protein